MYLTLELSPGRNREVALWLHDQTIRRGHAAASAPGDIARRRPSVEEDHILINSQPFVRRNRRCGTLYCTGSMHTHRNPHTIDCSSKLLVSTNIVCDSHPVVLRNRNRKWL